MNTAERMVTTLGMLIVSLVPAVSGQWVQTNGTSGGNFEAITSNESVLYTAVFGKGVFRSNDNGKTWTAMNAGLTDRDIYTLAAFGNDLVAGTEFNGIHIYSGNTGSWSHYEPVAGNTYQRIYHTVSRSDGVWLTTNEGLVKLYKNEAGWTDRLMLEMYSSTNVTFTEKRIFIYANSTLARSADNGETWDTCITGLQQSPISCLVMVDDSNGYISTDAGAFVTANSGDTWSAVSGSIEPGIRDVAVRNDTVLCLYPKRIAVSFDRGSTWSDLGGDRTFDDAKEIDLTGNTLVLTTARGIFITTFPDVQWVDVSPGIVSGNVTSLLSVGGTIFAGGDANGKLYRSVDNGYTWETSDSGFHPLSIVRSLTVFDSTLLAGCDFQELMQSTDFGRTWTEHKFANDVVLAFHERNGKLLLGNTVNGIMSIDARGTSFNTDMQEASNGLERELSDCNCSTPYPAIPAFATLNGTVFASIVRHGVYTSTDTDTGLTWYATSTGLTDSIVTALSATNGTLLAGTMDNGIFRSTDAGASWVRSETDFSGKSVSAFATYGTVAFAGTGDGVFYSIDSGETWENDDAAFSETVQALLVDGEYLFAGTAYAGVWRRPLSDFLMKATTPRPAGGLKGSSLIMRKQGTALSCSFTLTRTEKISIRLYDLKGKIIETVQEASVAPGKHTFTADLRRYSSGCYIVRLEGETVRRSLPFIISCR